MVIYEVKSYLEGPELKLARVIMGEEDGICLRQYAVGSCGFLLYNFDSIRFDSKQKETKQTRRNQKLQNEKDRTFALKASLEHAVLEGWEARPIRHTIVQPGSKLN